MTSELSPEELQALATERAKIFTRPWLSDLLAGRLGFGDTFWLGNFGVLLFAVPAVVLLAGVLYSQSAPLMMAFLRLAALVYGLWLGLVFIGLWRAKTRLGRLEGWGWTGLIFTAATAVYALFAAATL